jgi:hypothetical protein
VRDGSRALIKRIPPVMTIEWSLRLHGNAESFPVAGWGIVRCWKISLAASLSGLLRLLSPMSLLLFQLQLHTRIGWDVWSKIGIGKVDSVDGSPNTKCRWPMDEAMFARTIWAVLVFSQSLHLRKVTTIIEIHCVGSYGVLTYAQAYLKRNLQLD